MSAASDSDGRDPLDLLSEEFLHRVRRGEKLEVEAFAAAHAQHAEALRELLPTLLALEQLKRERESTGARTAGVPKLERLGDFRILHEIGRGGMGVVFAAVQESLGRKVALKVLPQAALLTGSQLERFRREAQTAAQLHHTHIVPVFGSGESDGYHWYAMQFIAGQSLDAWRAAQAKQPPQGPAAWSSRARFVARLGVQAADALHYAHGQGTLHRDVKPANLLLEAGEHLWITDFGLAKALESEGLTHSGDLLGTLQYMAPEQFAGRYDARSEVYALGVTLYELLVLRPAFVAKSRSELMERVRTERPVPLRRSCPDLPADLVLVIERAMARDPADRYTTAAAFAADLQAFLDDRAITARRQSVWSQARRWCRQNRTLAGLAGATLLAVAGAGAVGWISYGVTDRALAAAWESKRAAEHEQHLAQQQSQRADRNLQLALQAFGDVFDALVGRDPALAYEQDYDTGQTTVVARTVADAHSIALLQQMLRFYDEFAVANAANQELRLETARARRRVGAIYTRLGRPEHLERARSAYEMAQQLLEAITDREVGRELAALQLEFGLLEHRRGNLVAAAARLEAGLRLLEQDGQRDSRPVRYERAQLHFLLAQLADPTSLAAGAGLAGGNRGAAGPGTGPVTAPGPEATREALRKVLQTSKQHQQDALALLQPLLQAEPEHPDYRALQARCLLLDLPQRWGDASMRTGERTGERAGERTGDRPPEPGNRRPDRVRDPQQEAARREGLAIFRALVRQNPEADQLRYELCTALVEDRRREDRGRDFGPRARREASPLAEAELALLREAREHAELLVRQQPLVAEYAALRASVGTLLGRALRDHADSLPDAQQGPVRREAKAELQLALEQEQRLLEAGELRGGRYLMQALDTRRNLAGLCLALGERDEALAHVRSLLALVERPLAAAEARLAEGRSTEGRATEGRANDGRFGELRGLPLGWLGGMRPRTTEGSSWLLSDRLLAALEAPELTQRVRDFQSRMERLQASLRPERDGPPREGPIREGPPRENPPGEARRGR